MSSWNGDNECTCEQHLKTVSNPYRPWNFILFIKDFLFSDKQHGTKF